MQAAPVAMASKLPETPRTFQYNECLCRADRDTAALAAGHPYHQERQRRRSA